MEVGSGLCLLGIVASRHMECGLQVVMGSMDSHAASIARGRPR